MLQYDGILLSSALIASSINCTEFNKSTILTVLFEATDFKQQQHKMNGPTIEVTIANCFVCFTTRFCCCFLFGMHSSSVCKWMRATKSCSELVFYLKYHTHIHFIAFIYSKMMTKRNGRNDVEHLEKQQQIIHWAARVWLRSNKDFRIVWKSSMIMWVMNIRLLNATVCRLFSVAVQPNQQISIN